MVNRKYREQAQPDRLALQKTQPMTMRLKIASWNVNSIRSRQSLVSDWLLAQRPDVLCLQETKVQDADFPHEIFTTAGYEVAVYGQRSYNGVAIASRLPLADIRPGLPDDAPEDQRRVIAATVAGIRVVNVYVPNGEAVTSPKFAYKLDFLARLESYLKAVIANNKMVLLCGDFNIAPTAMDVYNADAVRETVMFHSKEHEHLNNLRALGLIDTFRLLHKDAVGVFSWWDYRAQSFRRNLGYRIDHIWATAPLAARCVESAIDKAERAREKPSDHAPAIAEFDLGD